MPENKTKATSLSVTAYIEGLTDPTRRSDARELVKVMHRASGEKPRLWGPSIVGFGSYHYKYESGREGDMMSLANAPTTSPINATQSQCIRSSDLQLCRKPQGPNAAVSIYRCGSSRNGV